MKMNTTPPVTTNNTDHLLTASERKTASQVRGRMFFIALLFGAFVGYVSVELLGNLIGSMVAIGVTLMIISGISSLSDRQCKDMDYQPPHNFTKDNKSLLDITNMNVDARYVRGHFDNPRDGY